MPDPVNGGPLDGEEYTEGGHETQKDPPAIPEPPKPDPIEEMRRTIANLEGQITSLRSNQYTQPAPAPKKPDEPDWENLLYTDPKEYTRLVRKAAVEEAEQKLTGKYNQDQSARDFWTAFYKDHNDLKDDDFMVKAVLQENMGLLGPMPAKEAGDKLAELTRNHILRYTGNKKSEGGKKTVTEGANPPTDKTPPPPKSTVTSLSDVIRARKANRLKGKGTAA